MEKKLNMSYQAMLWRIVGAVRRMAKDIPVFRDSHNGCIRITMIPLSRDADEWLGGGLYDAGYFDREHMGHEVIDFCERDFVFKIDPRGSHTIQYICEDGHTEPVNCYGYSALKTAWASWKRKFMTAERKNNLGETFADYQYRQHTQFFTEDNGWSMHDGSVVTTITLDGEDFVRLYVCTSGAKSSEDEMCSLAGILEAQECFNTYPGVAKFNPYVNGKQEPLQQMWID